MDTRLSLVPNKYRIHKTDTKHRLMASRNNLRVDARELLKQRDQLGDPDRVLGDVLTPVNQNALIRSGKMSKKRIIRLDPTKGTGAPVRLPFRQWPVFQYLIGIRNRLSKKQHATAMSNPLESRKNLTHQLPHSTVRTDHLHSDQLAATRAHRAHPTSGIVAPQSTTTPIVHTPQAHRGVHTTIDSSLAAGSSGPNRTRINDRMMTTEHMTIRNNKSQFAHENDMFVQPRGPTTSCMAAAVTTQLSQHPLQQQQQVSTQRSGETVKTVSQGPNAASASQSASHLRTHEPETTQSQRPPGISLSMNAIKNRTTTIQHDEGTQRGLARADTTTSYVPQQSSDMPNHQRPYVHHDTPVYDTVSYNPQQSSHTFSRRERTQLHEQGPRVDTVSYNPQQSSHTFSRRERTQLHEQGPRVDTVSYNPQQSSHTFSRRERTQLHEQGPCVDTVSYNPQQSSHTFSRRERTQLHEQGPRVDTVSYNPQQSSHTFSQRERTQLHEQGPRVDTVSYNPQQSSHTFSRDMFGRDTKGTVLSEISIYNKGNTMETVARVPHQKTGGIVTQDGSTTTTDRWTVMPRSASAANRIQPNNNNISYTNLAGTAIHHVTSAQPTTTQSHTIQNSNTANIDRLVGSRLLGHQGHPTVHDSNSAQANISTTDQGGIRYHNNVSGRISGHIQQTADSGSATMLLQRQQTQPIQIHSLGATSTTAGPEPQTDTIPRQTSSMGLYPLPSAGPHATTAAHNVQHTGQRNAEIDGGISQTQSTSAVTADQSVTFAHIHSTNLISHAIQSHTQNTSVMANGLVTQSTNPRSTEPQKIANTAQHGEFPLHRIAGIPVARNCG